MSDDEAADASVAIDVAASADSQQPQQQQQRTIVALLPDAAVGSSVSVVRLPHPRTGRPALYALIEAEPHELQRARPAPCGAWLIAGNRVAGDGAALLATPVDATFLALRSLAACGADFCAVDDALTRACADDVSCAAGMRALRGAKSLAAGLRRICTFRVVGGAEFVRIADAATVVAWLRERVDAVSRAIFGAKTSSDDGDKAAALRLRYLGAAGSFSAALRRPEDIDVTPEAATRAALGFLSECVPPEWLARVAESYGLGSNFVPARATATVRSHAAASFADHPKRGRAEVSYGAAAASASPSPSLMKTPQAKRARRESGATSSKKKRDLENAAKDCKSLLTMFGSGAAASKRNNSS